MAFPHNQSAGVGEVVARGKEKEIHTDRLAQKFHDFSLRQLSQATFLATVSKG
jgi:hypothetical protein